jgi:hypothetical protein
MTGIILAIAACAPAAIPPTDHAAVESSPSPSESDPAAATPPPVIPPPVIPPGEVPREEPPSAPTTPAVGDPPAVDGGDPDAVVSTDMPVRIEVRTSDEATAGFAETVLEILTDTRGWVRAGFHFREDPDAPYTIVLAEGDEVDRLCLPYDTYGLYSCQNGPVVALNADRWRSATPQWPSDLESYRVMLVNHEVGHLLHLHHPRPQCPAPGLPAPVMAQQSTTLEGCVPNPWPLEWEIDLAAARLEPLAPGADHDPSNHRPVPPPVHR